MSKYFLASLFRLKWFIACIIIVFFYLLLIIKYAENIPFTDDLAVLSSLYDIHQEPDWYLKFKTLFSFHNEHRIVIPRLITILIYYGQFQHIDVAWWVIIGNISIFLILYLYFKAGFTQHTIKSFMPILLFVLQPIHYELMYWGMASLQNIGVLVLSSFSFYQLTYSKNKSLAIVMAVLAVFTSANGVFAFIIGTALLLYKREWHKVIVWAMIGIMCTFLYWYGFSATENSGKSLSESFVVIRFLVTFTSLVGGIIYTQTFPFLSIILGSFLLIIISFVCYYQLIKQSIAPNYTQLQKINAQLFFFSCIGFILLTIAAISLGRNSNSILLVSRYKLYSALVIAITYALFIDWIVIRQYIFKLIMFTSSIFWLVSYTRYTPMFEVHSRLLFTHFFNWKYSEIVDIYPPFAEKYYTEHWNKVYQSGQYIPPKNVIEKSQNIISHFQKSPVMKTSFSVQGQIINIDPITLPTNEYYVLHKVQGKLAIYPLNTTVYRALYPLSEAEYSASINSAYWILSPETSLFIVPVH